MGVERTVNSEVAVHLAPGQAVPENVPFELNAYVQPIDWTSRLDKIQQVSRRYSKVLLERIWLLMMISAAVAVPWGLSSTVWKAVMRPGQAPSKAIGAHMIVVALFFAVVLLFCIPIVAWKLIGRWELNKMTRDWTRYDERMQGHSGGAATWRVSAPKLLKAGLTLTISIPVTRSPSIFHKDAYLPSYINRAASPENDDAYFYPYMKKEGSGLPRMSVVGNIPILFNEKNYDRV